MGARGELAFATHRGPQRAGHLGGSDEERDVAIAPLLDTGTDGRSGSDGRSVTLGAGGTRDLDFPWPRPALRLVRHTDGAGISATALRAGMDVGRRRASRAAVRRRRRAVVLTTATAALTCGLALPFAWLGGSPSATHPAAATAVAGETVYVVRPGDTLWSIAARLDQGGNPRPMAEALAREIGSAVVVPGERIPVP